MATLENVERLRERANVTYDEAKAALDACHDDLLEAMLLLERQGRVPPPSGGAYSTKQEPPRQSPHGGQRGETLGGLVRRFGTWLKVAVAKINKSSFAISKNEEIVANVPLTLLVLLAICAFWVVLPLLVVGMIFGYRYQIHGAVESITINKAMDSAAQAAEELKNSIKNTMDEKKATDQPQSEKD